MEFHSPVAAKRFWSYLRVAFFMLRKGLISKRKLIMDINLMMKRGKLIGKRRRRRHGYGLQEYEFSCENSPNPVFFYAKRTARHNYFPCIGVVAGEDDEGPPTVPSTVALPSSDAISPEINEVDYEAEEFIRRFYEQLRRQPRRGLAAI